MIVEAINKKDVNTKFGLKPTYALVIDGESYSLGFKKPACKIGDDIEFVESEDKYGKKIDPETIRVVSGGAASTGPVTRSTSTSSAKPAYTPAARPFPIPALHGDRAIVRQNSLTNAVKLFADTTSEATRQALSTEGAILKVLEIARGFEAYSCGDLEMAAALGKE